MGRSRQVMKWRGQTKYDPTTKLYIQDPHADHIVVRNIRYGSFAGKRLATVIDRCYTCSHRGDVIRGLEQFQVHR